MSLGARLYAEHQPQRAGKGEIRNPTITTMKNQIDPSSRSEAGRGNARSIVRRRDHAWPGLLLAGCCAVLTWFADYPARAVVSEAWVQRNTNNVASKEEVTFKVVFDGAGDIIVAGSAVTAVNGTDMLTTKYSGANGSVLWQQRSYAAARALAVDSSGNVLVTGISNNGYYTAKYAAADGALLWERRYIGPANNHDEARALALDGNDNVVVTGSSSNGEPNFDYDYYTAKYAGSDGALLWEKRYSSPGDYDDNAQAVAFDGNGNVVVTGSSAALSDSDTGERLTDYYTAKYAASNGMLLWEKRYNGQARDEASTLAVDASGNVVVTGFSATIDEFDRYHSADYYTAKYAATNGALLWEQRYDGPEWYPVGNVWRPDVALAVALDSKGNVVVTGRSSFSSGFGVWGFRIYTAKYAAADGALLWGKESWPGGDDDDGVAAVAVVDGTDDVVVTGSFGGGYYTAKYAGTDGTLLWEKRYNGPANGYDYVSGLALGPNGIVAITGRSDSEFGPGATYNNVTVVYREALSPLLLDLLPSGIRLRFTGIPARNYRIERAPAVTGPWSTINTQNAPASGLLEYLDAPAPRGQAFYRTVQP